MNSAAASVARPLTPSGASIPTFVSPETRVPERSLNRQRNPAPFPIRAPSARNPVYENIMNTISHVRSRKRRREEEALFEQRDGRPPRTCPYGIAALPPDEEPAEGMPATKRVKREETPSQNDQESPTTESVSTGTSSSPPPYSFIAPYPVSVAAASASTSSNYIPNTNVNHNVPFMASVFPGGPVTPEATRLAARLARRAQRSRRTHQEPPRLQTEHPTNILQQINGMVPAAEHNCHLHCQFHQNAHSLATGQHSVSPAIAPAAMASIRGNIAPPSPFAYPPYQYSALSVPVMMGVMLPLPIPPVPAPVQPAPPPFQNVYALRSASALPLAPLNGALTPEYFSSFLRSHELFYPAMERNGIDRHHMFAGLEIDVPVGASRAEIDFYTQAETYQKPEKEEEEETCTVCLSGYEQGERIRKLPCKHLFHPECIEKWLDINKRCPMCREEIDRSAREGF